MLEDAVTRQTLLEYWTRTKRFPAVASDIINWKAVRQAMAMSPPGLQRWVSKHTTGMCAVGKFRKIWGQAPSDECPRCGKPEDALHVHRCSSQVATEAWTQRLS